MTLARYGGESAVHTAANYLMSNDYAVVAPGSASDPLDQLRDDRRDGDLRAVSPVVLSSDPGVASNYPGWHGGHRISARATGTLAGSLPVTYRAVATLVSMRQITTYSGTTAVVQTWQITGRGVLPGSRPAVVEVSSVLERQVAPTFSYAAFATNPGCAALDWQGNSSTDSYDSAVSHIPDSPPYGGNVGTNGNLTLTGNAEINGTLSTIRSGVGSCAAGNALTGSLTKVDGMVELPQPVVYPPRHRRPRFSSTPKSRQPERQPDAPPGRYGDLDPIKGAADSPTGTYNINSIYMTSQGRIYVDGGPVMLNVAGYATAGVYEAVPSRAEPVTLYGGSTMNVGTYDPTMFVDQLRGSRDDLAAG